MGSMQKVFHADLSDAVPGAEYWVYAGGQRYDLKPHTAETRAKARANDPSFRAPDAQVTHYTDTTSVPDNTVMRVQLRMTIDSTGDSTGDGTVQNPTWAVVGAAIHVPTQPGSAAAPIQPQQNIDYVALAQTILYHHPDVLNKNDQDGSTTSDTTTSVASIIVNDYMINNPKVSSFVEAFAESLRKLGKPTVTKPGWAKLTMFTPPANADAGLDGSTSYYITTPNLTPDPTQSINDSIVSARTAAGNAMTALMVATKNDIRLQNIKWQQESGTSVIPAQSGASGGSGGGVVSDAMMMPAAHIEAAGGNATWNATLSNTGRVHGFEVSISVSDATKNELSITFNNYYIRYLCAYIQFYEADGKTTVPIPEGFSVGDDGTSGAIIDAFSALNIDIQPADHAFLGIVGPIDSFLAIPISSDPGTITVTVTFPEHAASATVFGSGIGTGKNDWHMMPFIGGMLTGIVNLTIPLFMLGFQVAAQSSKPLYQIIKGLTSSKTGLGSMIAGTVAVYGTMFGVDGAVNHKMDWSALSSLGTLLFNKALGQAFEWVEKQTTTQKAVEEIPFAGWIMVAIDLAIDVAQMAETITEVATSPWNIENNISVAITTTVSVHHDPRSQAFPAGTDRSYIVHMTYQDQTRPVVSSGAISVPDDSSSADPLSVSFPSNTLGGQVKFDAEYSCGDWTAAKATTGWMNNDEATVSNVNLYLVEIPRPLTSSSIYAHTSLLTYQGGPNAWVSPASAPTGTLTSNSNTATNAIEQWAGIALSQRSGTLFEAWQAVGLAMTDCTSGASGDLYAFAGVSIPGMAMVTTVPSCALVGPLQVVCDPNPPAFLMSNGSFQLDAKGNLQPDPSVPDLGMYYVDPRKADNDLTQDGGFHLRQFTVGGKSPVQMKGTLLSWGRFTYYPASIAMHPSGHVVAVSAISGQNGVGGKLQILQLEPEGTADALVPLAQVYSGQAFNPERMGLLFNPVAVACASDGTIFVLEDGKGTDIHGNPIVVARIQAFDLHGKPVNRFRDIMGRPSPFLPLVADPSVTYLDLAVVGNDKMTYMYVLSNDDKGYHMAIFQYGTQAPAANPLVTTDGVNAARIAVDMWHTLYTLNYDGLTDGKGNYVACSMPSMSEWLPPVPPPPPKT